MINIGLVSLSQDSDPKLIVQGFPFGKPGCGAVMVQVTKGDGPWNKNSILYLCCMWLWSFNSVIALIYYEINKDAFHTSHGHIIMVKILWDSRCISDKTISCFIYFWSWINIFVITVVTVTVSHTVYCTEFWKKYFHSNWLKVTPV